MRALVMLQMDEMRKLFAVWRKAKRTGVTLPATRDPAYRSLDALMHHPLRACRGYLTWLSKVLGKGELAIPDPPEPADVAAKGAAYLAMLEKQWHRHMAWPTERTLYSKKVHTSRWGHPMTVESMLEHAVAHPMRHRFQLEELLAGKPKRAPHAGRRMTRRKRSRAAS